MVTSYHLIARESGVHTSRKQIVSSVEAVSLMTFSDLIDIIP